MLSTRACRRALLPALLHALPHAAGLHAPPAARGARESAAMRIVKETVGLSELQVPAPGGDDVTLIAPACADKLLEAYVEHEAAFGHRTPYYGIVWPAAVALAREMDRRVVQGDAVLELGSGLGLGGIAAALTRQPARVTLTDHDPVAVELGLASAAANGVRHLVDGAQLDWTRPDEWPADGYSLVIAADVIYEPAAAAHVAEVARRSLRRGGRFVCADLLHRPFRPQLREALLARGFEPSAGEGGGEDCRVVQTTWEEGTHAVVVSSYRWV